MSYDDFEDGDIEDAGPDEDDLVTSDHVHFYSGRKLALTIQVREPPSYIGERGTHTRDADEGEVSDAAMWRQIEAHMKKQRFWPNVWFESDHGNYHLLQKPKRPKRSTTSRHTPGRWPRRR